MRLPQPLKSLMTGFAAVIALASCSQNVPEDAEMFGTPLSEEADEFLTACNTELNQKQQALEERWLGDYERYDVDLERGVLRLSRESKAPIHFDVEVVGSYSSTHDNWEWAWNNPNVIKSLAVPREALVEVARKYGLKYLTSGFVPVPEEKFPYYLSGIALKIRGAMGVFEATSGDLSIFLLLKNPREGDS